MGRVSAQRLVDEDLGVNSGLARIPSAIRSLKLKAPSRFQDQGHPGQRLLRQIQGMRLRQAPL